MRLQFAVQLRQPRFAFLDFRIGKFAHFWIFRHFTGGGDIALTGLIGVKQLHHRFELGAFAVQLSIRIHVAGGLFSAQQLIDFEQALTQLSEFGGDIWFHCSSILKVKQACPEPGRRDGDERTTQAVHMHGNE